MVDLKIPIWEHFFAVERNGKWYVQCKSCNYEQSNKVCRMKAHFLKCSSEHSDESVPMKTLKRKANDYVDEFPVVKKQCIISVQHHVDSVVVKTSKTWKDTTDNKVSKYFLTATFLSPP